MSSASLLLSETGKNYLNTHTHTFKFKAPGNGPKGQTANEQLFNKIYEDSV